MKQTNTSTVRYYSPLRHVLNGLMLVIVAPVVLALITLGFDYYLPSLFGENSALTIIPIALMLAASVLLSLFFLGVTIVGVIQSIIIVITYRPPERCMNCQKKVKLHGYHLNTLSTKNEYFFICSECLLKQLKSDLETSNSNVVFVEPLLEEGYAYTPFSKEIQEGVNLLTYVPTKVEKCDTCAKPAKTVWLPLEVMRNSRGALYYFKKGEFKKYRYYCYDHIVEVFGKHLKRKIFRDFWSVREQEDGYFL